MIEIAAEEEYIDDEDYPGAKELGEDIEEIDDTLHGNEDEEEDDTDAEVDVDEEIEFDDKEKLEDEYDDEADAY